MSVSDWISNSVSSTRSSCACFAHFDVLRRVPGSVSFVQLFVCHLSVGLVQDVPPPRNCFARFTVLFQTCVLLCSTRTGVLFKAYVRQLVRAIAIASNLLSVRLRNRSRDGLQLSMFGSTLSKQLLRYRCQYRRYQREHHAVQNLRQNSAADRMHYTKVHVIGPLRAKQNLFAEEGSHWAQIAATTIHIAQAVTEQTRVHMGKVRSKSRKGPMSTMVTKAHNETRS